MGWLGGSAEKPVGGLLAGNGGGDVEDRKGAEDSSPVASGATSADSTATSTVCL